MKWTTNTFRSMFYIFCTDTPFAEPQIRCRQSDTYAARKGLVTGNDKALLLNNYSRASPRAPMPNETYSVHSYPLVSLYIYISPFHGRY